MIPLTTQSGIRTSHPSTRRMYGNAGLGQARGDLAKLRGDPSRTLRVLHLHTLALTEHACALSSGGPSVTGRPRDRAGRSERARSPNPASRIASSTRRRTCCKRGPTLRHGLSGVLSSPPLWLALAQLRHSLCAAVIAHEGFAFQGCSSRREGRAYRAGMVASRPPTVHADTSPPSPELRGPLRMARKRRGVHRPLVGGERRCLLSPRRCCHDA
jgi:hypothetical protein